MNSIFQKDPSCSFLILRLRLAIAFSPTDHNNSSLGLGGRGFKGTLNNWKEKYRIPTPIGAIGIFTKFFGSIALLVGFLTRPFALGLTIARLGPIQKSHWNYGYFLALSLMSLARLVGAGGAISIDHLLSNELGWKHPSRPSSPVLIATKWPRVVRSSAPL